MDHLFNSSRGRLNLICGPMYSGKTSRLLNVQRQLALCNIPCVVINHISDTRYSNSASIVENHDEVSIKGEVCNLLYEKFSPNAPLFTNNNAFLVNEAQFFRDVVEWSKMAVSAPYHKVVYLAGLDGDFQRDMFGDWLTLISHADTIEKLCAVCMKCKNAQAPFTWRTTSERAQVLVADDCHIPVCRGCYEYLSAQRATENS